MELLYFWKFQMKNIYLDFQFLKFVSLVFQFLVLKHNHCAFAYLHWIKLAEFVTYHQKTNKSYFFSFANLFIIYICLPLVGTWINIFWCICQKKNEKYAPMLTFRVCISLCMLMALDQLLFLLLICQIFKTSFHQFYFLQKNRY